MKNLTIKANSITRAIITAVFVLAVSVAFFIMSGVNANATDDIALTVQLNGIDKKTYTIDQLEALYNPENMYSYSSWNTFPAYSIIENISGPTIDAILKNAGIRNKVTDTSVVAFDGVGYEIKLTGKQLFTEARYYYPNISLISSNNGINPDESTDAYDGKEEVPAIICLDSGTLYIGQVAPNEENNPLFVKYMTGLDGKSGIINVSTETAPRCDKVAVNYKSESLIPFNPENPAEIEISDIEGSSNTSYDKIYYALYESSEKNKTAPGYGFRIYNWGTFKKPFINIKPLLNKSGIFTFMVRVKGYGKQDSILQTFTYYVGPALNVKLIGSDGNVKSEKSYKTLAELKSQFPEHTSLTYSGYNTYPTFSKKSNLSGIKVEDIINDAIPSFNISEHLNDSTIKFTTGSDKYSTELTLNQLFCNRYFYPNAKAGTNTKGGAAKSAAYDGKVKVPAIIETTGKNTFEFGQSVPNDQNFAECVDKMLTLGTIEIKEHSSMPKCDDVEKSFPEDGATITAGSAIKFPFPSEDKDKRMKTYYIVNPKDGNEPREGNAFYNYAAFFWPKEIINAPVLTQPGKNTIAVRNICYGRADSDVTRFTYNVTPAKPSGLTAKTASYKSIKLSWKKYSYASGYKIYRSTGSGKAKLIKSITSGNTTSYTNSGLTTGTTYKYYIVATGIKTTDGSLVNSPQSTAVKAKPIPGTPTVKLTSGKKLIKVKWSKVTGASGYVIYRSTKKTTGFKAIKTIKSGKTLSFTNKNLKSRKTYYYKVKAYRTVSKKKIYSNYSAVKYAKTK